MSAVPPGLKLITVGQSGQYQEEKPETDFSPEVSAHT